MTAQSPVRVLYRHVEIASSASVTARDGDLRFVSLDAPPPVRTVLQLAAGDGTATVVEVVRAIELGDAAERGCLVKVLEAAPATAVGTERLPDGAKISRPPTTDPEPDGDDAGADDDDAADEGAVADEPGYGAHMAVPAPVIGDDDSGPVELGESPASAGDDDGGGDESSAPAKKRRGRKRR